MTSPIAQSIGGEDLVKALLLQRALFRRAKRRKVEATNKVIQRKVKAMAASTPDSRMAAATAKAAVVHAKIDQIAADADVQVANQNPPVQDLSIEDVPIYDFDTLFNLRQRLEGWYNDRLETIHAKINWVREDGRPGYFNQIAHHPKHPIPVADELAIYAGIGRSDSHDGSRWVDSLIKCGLFVNAHNGGRCQNLDCRLCNWSDTSRGVKLLLESYDEAAYYRGVHWFAITGAPRTDPRMAKAVGRVITSEDWNPENPESAVFRESCQPKVFEYDDQKDGYDFVVESRVRLFLGAIQATYARLAKNGWMDGIRAKAEVALDFVPFRTHWHSHATGNSLVEHDPQTMAEFIKDEVDSILASTGRGLYADVLVAVIPTPEDLQRWIAYSNKTMDILAPVQSFYYRHPGVRRDDPDYNQLYHQLCVMRERITRLFGMSRFPLTNEVGCHTYHLRRHFCRGNQRFGGRSVLSEPAWHKELREKKADQQRERRGAADANGDEPKWHKRKRHKAAEALKKTRERAKARRAEDEASGEKAPRKPVNRGRKNSRRLSRSLARRIQKPGNTLGAHPIRHADERATAKETRERAKSNALAPHRAPDQSGQPDNAVDGIQAKGPSANKNGRLRPLAYLVARRGLPGRDSS